MAATLKEVRADIAKNRTRFQRADACGVDSGHEYLTIQIVDRLFDLVRYHGVWSPYVLAKYAGIAPSSIYYYINRYPQARELFNQAREEFRTYLAQGTLERIFALLDNPRADSKAKATLLAKLIEKTHPDLKDKIDVAETSSPEDRRIVVSIKDHGKPTGTPVAIVVGGGVAEEPPQRPMTCLPEAEIEAREAEAVSKDLPLGLNLFSTTKRKNS